MCGIAGVINLDNEPVSPSVLQGMGDVLSHRGPDDEGFFINGGAGPSSDKWKRCSGPGHVGLVHRRLSIIDLSSGHQPMTNETDEIWVTYNGEIYNYRELRSLLKQKGHVFKTDSDTEVIVHAYEEWGEGIVVNKKRTLRLSCNL
ncbi:class II glutamine amidotransferase domain-containing protein [Desulfoluna spongiiphila]|uniref:hypothetical protein n=1 Tax=Desulfoluna spongiiphila TaxID=419481 RepID=UPI00125B0A8A|nr:hypothetical protein [Desulfoluna spongiiphila]VVS93991.1 glutamine amidotransferase type 2 domain [Desulfoluna spongiiphila]